MKALLSEKTTMTALPKLSCFIRPQPHKLGFCAARREPCAFYAIHEARRTEARGEYCEVDDLNLELIQRALIRCR